MHRFFLYNSYFFPETIQSVLLWKNRSYLLRSFPSKKGVSAANSILHKATAWKNFKNALVLTLCTCSWGSWDSGKDVWLVWGHVDGGMERLLHVLLRPHGAFLPLLHTAAAAASPCSMAKVPRCVGLPSFLFSPSPPSLCVCWDEWFLFYSAFGLRHILCVCVLDTHHSTIQYLSSLFINRIIHPFLWQASVHVLLSSNGLKVWNP